MSTGGVHHISSQVYGGSKSEHYNKLRKSYHATVLAFMYDALPKKDNLNVVEMAAGTGLLTRALLADSQWDAAIAKLMVTEPEAGMREILQTTVKDPRVSISSDTFENTTIPDAWADAVVIATAFHWCNDLEAACQQFKRILKPHGVVIMIWNFEDRSVPWINQMWELGTEYTQLTGKTTLNFSQWPFRRLFDLPSYKKAFQEPFEEAIKYPTEDNVDLVVSRFGTWGAIASESGEEQEKALSAVRKIVLTGDGMAWINREEGTLVLPMACPAIVIRRK